MPPAGKMRPIDRSAAMSRRTWLRAAAAWGLAAAMELPARAALAGGLRVGAPAPPATLTTLDGTRISTPDLLGDVVILTFWATWCEPCREELPVLSSYAKRHAADGLRVLGFSLDGPENLAEVRSLASSLAFPVGLLGDPHVPGYGRIWRLPVNFTIDRRGRLADDGWAARPAHWTAERLEHVVTPLLGAS